MKVGENGIMLDERVHRASRVIGLVAPVIITLYSFLIAFQIIPSTNYSGLEALTAITLCGIGLGVYQWIWQTRDIRWLRVRLALYHIFGGLLILFVSGFSLAFLSAWAILYLVAYLYAYTEGFILSVIFLFIVILVDLALHPDNIAILPETLTNATGTTIVGLAAVMISQLRQEERDQLARTAKREQFERDSILTLINNLADAIISTDTNGSIRIYNAAMLNLLDTNNAIDGKHIDDVVTLYDPAGKVVRLTDFLKQTRGVTTNDSLKTVVAGEDMRLELSYTPIRSGYGKSKKKNEQDGYIVIMRDITKAKSLEEERDEFISVVSHELRTPIAIAEGTISNTQVLFEKDDIHDDKLREGLEMAHDQVIFLAKMVNDLSTLSRAERGVADTPEDINVQGLIEGLFHEYSPEAKKKGLQLNLDIKGKLGTVLASQLYLHELLQNFITNAIKYTNEGTVTLSAHQEGTTVTFAVSDTGIGISKADQAKIYDKFYRAEDYRTRETSGTGLGLYVAKKLAKKIGCAIELSSRLNHGSTFSFSLPLKQD